MAVSSDLPLLQLTWVFILVVTLLGGGLSLVRLALRSTVAPPLAKGHAETRAETKEPRMAYEKSA